MTMSWAGSNDLPDEQADVIMAKMRGHERLLRSLYPRADQREMVINQLLMLANELDKHGRTNFRDAALALAEEMDKSK